MTESEVIVPLYHLFVDLGIVVMLIGWVMYFSEPRKFVESLRFMVLFFLVFVGMKYWVPGIRILTNVFNTSGTQIQEEMSTIFKNILSAKFENSDSWWPSTEMIAEKIMYFLFKTVAYFGSWIKELYILFQNGLINILFITAPLTLATLTIPTFRSTAIKFIISSLAISMWAIGFAFVDLILIEALNSLILDDLTTANITGTAAVAIATITFPQTAVAAFLMFMLIALFLYILVPVLVYTILHGGSIGGVISKATNSAFSAAVTGASAGAGAAIGGRVGDDLLGGGSGGSGSGGGGGGGGSRGGGDSFSPGENALMSAPDNTGTNNGVFQGGGGQGRTPINGATGGVFDVDAAASSGGRVDSSPTQTSINSSPEPISHVDSSVQPNSNGTYSLSDIQSGVATAASKGNPRAQKIMQQMSSTSTDLNSEVERADQDNQQGGR